MSDIAAIHNTWLAAEAGEALRRIGVGVFAFAMVALGVETLISARDAAQVLGASIQRYSSDSVAACDFLARLPVRSSVGGLRRGTSIAAHSASGCAHSVCALVLDVPKNAANIGSISLRTAVFEPLALAGLAWLFPGRVSTPDFLACAGATCSRFL
jgi:hypothetical protein